MQRVVYVSRSTAKSDEEAAGHLAEILAVARRLNRARGITGALAYGNGWYTQVLEGDAEPLMRTLTAILGDARHTQVEILEMTPISERAFLDWSMAFAGDASPVELRRAVERHEQRQEGGVESVLTLGDLARFSKEIADTFARRLPLH